MKQLIYALYDKNSMSTRCTGIFNTDSDAVVSFLTRLPNYSATINTCDVRLVGSFDSDTLLVDPLPVKTVAWSTVNFEDLPASLINNLKLYGSIPSDVKPITPEWLDKRLHDIEESIKAFADAASSSGKLN